MWGVGGTGEGDTYFPGHNNASGKNVDARCRGRPHQLLLHSLSDNHGRALGNYLNMMPWPRELINAHTTFKEAGDLSLTPEELLQRDEARQARQKQHFKNSYIKNGQRMRDKECTVRG